MLKFRKLSTAKDKIYGYADMCGFGDIWALTSYLLRVSEEAGRPTRFFTRNEKIRAIIRSIIPHLRSKGKIHLAHNPLQKQLGYCEPFLVKFVPTHKKWQYNRASNIVAYQFDGNHLGNEKNLPWQRQLYLLRSLRRMGFIPVDVGHKKPIRFIVDTLSKCRFFVGCPSGLSVVSISVGNPVYLITRSINPKYCGFMRNCQYKTKEVHMYRTVDEFLIQARRMNRMGKLL